MLSLLWSWASFHLKVTGKLFVDFVAGSTDNSSSNCCCCFNSSNNL